MRKRDFWATSDQRMFKDGLAFRIFQRHDVSYSPHPRLKCSSNNSVQAFLCKANGKQLSLKLSVMSCLSLRWDLRTQKQQKGMKMFKGTGCGSEALIEPPHLHQGGDHFHLLSWVVVLPLPTELICWLSHCGLYFGMREWMREWMNEMRNIMWRSTWTENPCCSLRFVDCSGLKKQAVGEIQQLCLWSVEAHRPACFQQLNISAIEMWCAATVFLLIKWDGWDNIILFGSWPDMGSIWRPFSIDKEASEELGETESFRILV